MQGWMNLLSDRACRMTDVYSPGIDITEYLLGDSLLSRSPRVRFEASNSTTLTPTGTRHHIHFSGFGCSSTAKSGATAIESWLSIRNYPSRSR